jgi:hypothetical protein
LHQNCAGLGNVANKRFGTFDRVKKQKRQQDAGATVKGRNNIQPLLYTKSKQFVKEKMGGG